MRLAILTTETQHHAHFVREMGRNWDVGRVFVETDGVRAPFDTAHPFEAEREEREAAHWFGGQRGRIADFADTQCFASMNAPAAVQAVVDYAPDVTLVFGTGRLHQAVISAAGLILNLHGGDPEDYRGLDSHLWAIYHGDFTGLVTTLHRLSLGLDEGDIVLQEHLRPTAGAGQSLADLRRVNTDACIRLCNAALDMVRRDGAVLSRPQRRRGRYYSFMPAALKEICVRKFDRYLAVAP